jgi:hypothetical protein
LFYYFKLKHMSHEAIRHKYFPETTIHIFSVTYITRNLRLTNQAILSFCIVIQLFSQTVCSNHTRSARKLELNENSTYCSCCQQTNYTSRSDTQPDCHILAQQCTRLSQIYCCWILSQLPLTCSSDSHNRCRWRSLFYFKERFSQHSNCHSWSLLQFVSNELVSRER